MRHSFRITRFAIPAALAAEHWSTVNADSSFKVVTAPTDTRQVQTEGLTGSSFRVVTAPSDTRQVQTDKTVVPHADETPRIEPVAGAPPGNNDLTSIKPERIELRLGFDSPYKLDEFADFVISDPTIIDVIPRSTSTFHFRPKSLGITSVIVYDKSNNLIKTFGVEVGGETQMVNLPQFGAQKYRCWDTGCVNAGQTKYEKPTEKV